MVDSRPVRCRMCFGASIGGDIMFRKEIRRGFSWVSNQALETYPLCAECFPWASGVISMVVRGEGADSGLLGVPFPQADLQDSAEICSYCRRELKTEAVGTDVVPTRRDFVRHSLSRHVGGIQQHRLCNECYHWTRSILEDSSAMKGASNRAAEGPSGNWLATADFHAFGVGLLKRDEFVLQQTVEGSGRHFERRMVSSCVVPEDGETVLFVGAGRGQRTAGLIGSQTPMQKTRTVIVARSDAAPDAFAAMLEQAGDLLVSPLSPQQVAGAFDRLRDPRAIRGRDAATGLPRYRVDETRFGMPAHQISVSLHKGVTIQEAAIYARRYLRGYDRVGVDAQGDLRLQVYCPSENVPLVLKRLASLAGDKGKFELLEQAARAAAA